MRVLANTVLTYNNDRMGYEILHMHGMLLFSPYYYNDHHFPCIVLNRLDSVWRFQENVDEGIERQVLEDIQCLKDNRRTAPLIK